MLNQILSIALLSATAFADIAPPAIPNCALDDIKCLTRAAQYTVVGTIVSTNLGEPGSTATAGRYNATMAIRCMWASFSSPPSPGTGLVNKQVLVTNWGFPKAGCPPNTGAVAETGQTRMYFLYVGRTFANSPPENTIFSVQSICVGGLPATNDNAQKVAEVLLDAPSNTISTQNRGTDEFCTLPVVTGTGTNGGNNGTATFDPNVGQGLKLSFMAMSAFVVSVVLLL